MCEASRKVCKSCMRVMVCEACRKVCEACKGCKDFVLFVDGCVRQVRWNVRLFQGLDFRIMLEACRSV